MERLGIIVQRNILVHEEKRGHHDKWVKSIPARFASELSRGINKAFLLLLFFWLHGS